MLNEYKESCRQSRSELQIGLKCSNICLFASPSHEHFSDRLEHTCLTLQYVLNFGKKNSCDGFVEYLGIASQQLDPVG